MHVAGYRKPQQLLQVNLFGRCIQQIKASDDMVNVLQVIINDNGKLVGNNVVFALDDKVAILLGEVVGNQALQFILKGNGAAVYFNPQCMGAIRKGLSVSANAGVNIGAIDNSQRFPATGTRINKSVSLQVAYSIVISVNMPALVINIAVPLQAEGIQRF
jgi:hypothetical protein